MPLTDAGTDRRGGVAVENLALLIEGTLVVVVIAAVSTLLGR